MFTDFATTPDKVDEADILQFRSRVIALIGKVEKQHTNGRDGIERVVETLMKPYEGVADTDLPLPIQELGTRATFAKFKVAFKELDKYAEKVRNVTKENLLQLCTDGKRALEEFQRPAEKLLKHVSTLRQSKSALTKQSQEVKRKTKQEQAKWMKPFVDGQLVPELHAFLLELAGPDLPVETFEPANGNKFNDTSDSLLDQVRNF